MIYKNYCITTLICPVALWPSLPPPGGAAGMCCRSAALPQALLTPAAAPEADPDCLHLLRRLLTWISSEGPSPDLGSTKHAEIPDEVREATFISFIFPPLSLCLYPWLLRWCLLRARVRAGWSLLPCCAPQSADTCQDFQTANAYSTLYCHSWWLVDNEEASAEIKKTGTEFPSA